MNHPAVEYSQPGNKQLSRWWLCPGFQVCSCRMALQPGNQLTAVPLPASLNYQYQPPPSRGLFTTILISLGERECKLSRLESVVKRLTDNLFIFCQQHSDWDWRMTFQQHAKLTGRSNVSGPRSLYREGGQTGTLLFLNTRGGKLEISLKRRTIHLSVEQKE